MEKKQGFFSALKEEVVRGLSPSRSRGSSPARSGSPMAALLRRKKHHHHVAQPDALIARSGSLRPVMEGPDPDGGEIGESKRVGSGLGHWMKGQLSRAPSVTSMSYKRSDLRLLLGVMGAPLAPVHVNSNDPLPHLSIKDTPIVSFFHLPLLPVLHFLSIGLSHSLLFVIKPFENFCPFAVVWLPNEKSNGF